MEILRINRLLMGSQGGILRAGQPLYVRPYLVEESIIQTIVGDYDDELEGINMADILQAENNL